MTRASLGLAIVCSVFVVASCAPKLAPVPAPGNPQYPDFVFPAVPASLTGDSVARVRQERGWNLLQRNEPRAAEREFSAALQRNPRFFPAEAGLGYVRLSDKDYKAALQRFDRVLERDPRYVSALAGRGDALLGAGRALDALAAFEQVLAVDPAQAVARQRVQVLQLRTLQQQIEGARKAADAGRYDEARRGYEHAIAASPESGFLYRDLGTVERRQGDTKAALTSFRKAVALDPHDARSWVQIAELLEANGDADGAVQAYTQAVAADPSDVMNGRLEAARQRAALAHLPVEYRDIPLTPRLTRAELAALIGVRFQPLLDTRTPTVAVLLTDTRGNWAEPWILPVVRNGIMDAFPNHTFRPRLGVTRMDMARVVSRVLGLAAAARPGLAARWRQQPRIADVPAGHLSYSAVATAVASGVMPLFEDGTFRPGQAVSGEEAVQVMDRLEGVTGVRSGDRNP